MSDLSQNCVVFTTCIGSVRKFYFRTYEKLININRARLQQGDIYKYIKSFKSCRKDKSLPDPDNRSSASILCSILYPYDNLAEAPTSSQ